MARNPFEDVEELLNRLSRQVEEGMARGSSVPSPSSVAVDVADHDDEYVVTADLPGYEIDDIDLRLADGTLRIEAEREESREFGSDDSDADAGFDDSETDASFEDDEGDTNAGFDDSEADASFDDGGESESSVVATDDRPTRYLRRERTSQSVSRRLRLPDPIDEEAVSASHSNGVLTVTLPKLSSGNSSRRIDID